MQAAIDEAFCELICGPEVRENCPTLEQRVKNALLILGKYQASIG